jgi:hypothetical protein
MCFFQALNHFTAVESFFTSFREDQYDFHGYSFRNVTLKAYLEVWSVAVHNSPSSRASS